ncbi:MAG TPA: glycosyltransferase [Glaciihabitans sp.]|jgi:hypothetical protein|nr:glycosyltransferase [Glaciihabitans sp.]
MSVTSSVALGTYNGAQYVGEQLASILGGSVLPTEIVVSDDGSTDTTLTEVREALREAERRGIRTQIIEGRAGGVTANFARAIAACSSEVVVLCDQDDRWHTSRLASALHAFEADATLLFQHANAALVDGAGSDLDLTLFEALSVRPEDRERINAGEAFEVYLRRNLATGATVAFRRSLLEAAAPLPAEWVHDEWLAMIAAALGSGTGASTVAVTDAVLIDYRQHGSNQIGVAKPTLLYRIQRMLGTDPNRNRLLATRSRILAKKLAELDGVSAERRELAEAKARFELHRATMPPGHLARIPAVWRASRGGGYQRFASQGSLDILRDLLQTGRAGSSL